MKILAYLFIITILLEGCNTDSKHPPNNLNKFANVYEKGLSVQDFRGYRIQTRGSAYLVSFPDIEHWFVYDYDKETAKLNLENYEALLDKNILTNTDSNFADSLNLEALTRIAILSDYKIIKVDGRLDNNEIIEFSFSSVDVLAYINSSEDSLGGRQEFLKTNAKKLSGNWYYLRRDVPLDLSNY